MMESTGSVDKNWQQFWRECDMDTPAKKKLLSANTEKYAEQPIGDTALLAPLEKRGVLQISGVDARRFLHGQSTVSLAALCAGAAGIAAVCTPAGRVVANFRFALPEEESLLLSMPREMLIPLHDFLAKFIVFSRAEQRDVCENFLLFGLVGRDVSALARAVFGAAAAPGNCIAVDAGILSTLNASRIECLLHREQALKYWRKLCAASALPCSSTFWELLDIRAGYAESNLATTQKFVPQYMNLDCLQGVDFHKGCYTGQEIIVRLQHRGMIKQRSARLLATADNEPAPGDPLYAIGAERPCGHVLTAARITAREWEILAVLPHPLPGELYLHTAPEQGAALEILPLPYSTSL